MKKEILVIFCLMFAVSLIFAETPYYEESHSSGSLSESSNYQVTNLRYEPYPVSPGEYFTIWIEVTKSSSQNNDVVFTLQQDYPFSLDLGVNPDKEYTNIGNQPVVLEYKVRVADDAVSGTNKLVLVETWNSGNRIDHEFDIEIMDVKTSFDSVLQDSTDGSVSIAIANIGSNDALATIVRVPSQEGITVSGTNGQMIGNLEQGDYTIVAFDLTGKSEILTLQVDYTDGIGKRRTEYIEVPLNGEASSSISQTQQNNFTNSPIRQTQTTSSSSLLTWLSVGIGLILIIVFIIWYKKRNSRRNSKTETPDWINKAKKGK